MVALNRNICRTLPARLRGRFRQRDTGEYQSNWQTIKIGNKWWGLSVSRIMDFATGRFTQRDPLPGLIKVVRAIGSRLGIYSGTSLAATVRFAANSDSASLYVRWFLNTYRAWSSSPVTQIDRTGFEDAPPSQTFIERRFGKDYVRIEVEVCSDPCMHAHVGSSPQDAVKYYFRGNRFQQIPNAIFNRLISNPASKAAIQNAIRRATNFARAHGGKLCVVVTLTLALSEAAEAGESGGADAVAESLAGSATEYIAGAAGTTALGYGASAAGLTTATGSGALALGETALGATAASAGAVGAAVLVTAYAGYELGSAIGNTQTAQGVGDWLGRTFPWAFNR